MKKCFNLLELIASGPPKRPPGPPRPSPRRWNWNFIGWIAGFVMAIVFGVLGIMLA